MSSTPSLFDDVPEDKRPDWQLARPTDPHTSHDAAASLRAVKLTEVRRLILELLRRSETGMTDVRIAGAWTGPQVSPSGLRTRRSELVEMELVKDSGRTETLPSGRKAVVWVAA